MLLKLGGHQIRHITLLPSRVYLAYEYSRRGGVVDEVLRQKNGWAVIASCLKNTLSM